MAQPVRIATFNLESLDDRTGRSGIDFADRVAVLRPQLIRLRADVLCLQEINGRAESRKGERHLTGLDRLVAGTDYAGYHRVVSTNRGGRRAADRHNLVVLSRLAVEHSVQVWHDLVPPPLCRLVTAQPAPAEPVAVEWDRPLLHVCLRLGGARLHVLNLHLRAPRATFLPGQKGHGMWHSVGGWAEGFYLAELKRAGQALEARLVLEGIFDAEADALVAVCGDFNAEDREAPLRAIRGDEEDTGNGHLAARVLIPLDRSLADSQRYSVVHHGRRIMLDHILASRRLLGFYRGIEVHNEGLGDELVSPLLVRGAPDTYHAPVVAEFTMPELRQGEPP